MKSRDIISALFWAAFGAVFAVQGFRLGLIQDGIPGPGALPSIVGIICIGLCIIIFFQALRKRSIHLKFFPDQNSFRQLALAVAGIFGYGLLLKRVGFVGTTFLFLIFVTSLIGREKRLFSFLFSLLTAALSYLMFSALQLELPRGILGL